MSIETIIDPDADIRSALAEAAAFDDTPAPVATDWARAALDAYYGLDQAPEAVPGSRHAAFRVVLDDGSAGVLQVSHPDADPVAVDFQTQALLHVGRADPGLPVQRIVPARDGATSLWLADDAGRARLVRLLTRLDGPPMSDAAVSDAAAVPVARTLARLHRALSGLWHPGGEKSLPGDLRRADRLRPLLGLLPDDDGQALAHAALDDFERRARALLPALRQQPIHNGLTRDRLLADPAAPGRIVGILGFDRMVEAPLVADLAVALSDWIDPAPGTTTPPGHSPASPVSPPPTTRSRRCRTSK